MFLLDTNIKLQHIGITLTMDDFNEIIKPKVTYLHQFFVAVCNTNNRYFSERDIHNYIVANIVNTDGVTAFMSPICCYSEKLIIDMFVTLVLEYNRCDMPATSDLIIACDILRYFLRIRCVEFILGKDISSKDIVSSLENCLRNEYKLRGWVDSLLEINNNVSDMFPVAYYFYFVFNNSSVDLDYKTIKSAMYDSDDIEHPGITFIDAVNTLFGSEGALDTYEDYIFYNLFTVAPWRELSPLFYVDKDVIADLNKVHDVVSYNLLVDSYSTKYRYNAPATYVLVFELYRRFVLNNGMCRSICVAPNCDYASIVGLVRGTYYKKRFTSVSQPRIVTSGADSVVVPDCIHTLSRDKPNYYYTCTVDLHDDLIDLVDSYYDILMHGWIAVHSMEMVFERLNALISCDTNLALTVFQCMQFKFEMISVLGMSCIFKSISGHKYHSRQFFGDKLYLGNYISASRLKNMSSEDRMQYIDDCLSNYNKSCSELRHEPMYDRYSARKADIVSNLYKLKRNLPSMAAFILGALLDKGTTVILVGIAITCVLFILLNNINVAVLSEKIYRIIYRNKK